MSEGLRLDGSIIPRSVRRMFDQRREPRAAIPASAQFEWSMGAGDVRVANLSTSGAMIECGAVPRIGEAVILTLPGEAPARGVVRWVRDGRIGLHFVASVG